MIETLKSLAEGAGHSSMWTPAVPQRDDPAAVPGQSLENPRTSWDRVFETEPSHAGKTVTEISSLQLAAVWRCVSIISGAIARTPFLPYRRTAEGRKIARDHYLWPVLMRQANPFMSAYRFKRIMSARVCLWGNSYALIDENGRGQVTALWAIRPDRMRPKALYDREGRITAMAYVYSTNDGQQITFAGRDILHLRGLETDGFMGLSPISANRQSIGLAQAAEEYGARYFSQGTHVGGWVSHPSVLGPKAKKNLEETMNDLYSGLHGAHRIAVLEENMRYEPVGIPPEDMQFLQTRQFQAIDIARLFGVPPHMIAELSRATFSNIEHQSIEFVQTCLDDWFVNFEEEFMNSLLSPREMGIDGQLPTGSIELDFYEQKLLRGDQGSRFATYAIARQNTILSPNECREMEGLNKIDEPWADDYMQPLNMLPAGQEQPDPLDPEDPDAEDEPDGPVAPAVDPEVPGVAPLKKPAPKKKEK